LSFGTSVAREGVLVKGGQALEDLARVQTVAIDKTGTLTQGLPQLADIVGLDGTAEDDVLSLVRAPARGCARPRRARPRPDGG
jgi:Zn2+/Cd2+-exporting ATPase